MLVSFRVKNFKSIVDATLDLRYGEGKAPNGYAEMDRMPFLQADMGENAPKNTRPLRVVPVLAIYGQNAGGKSTMVEAMREFWRLICTYPLNSYAEQLSFQPNVLHPELRETEYVVETARNGKLFHYMIAHNRDGVIREEFRCGDKQNYFIDHEKGIFRVDEIATEAYPAQRMRSILDVECSAADGRQISAFLKKLHSGYGGLSEDVAGFVKDLVPGLSIHPDNEIRPMMGLERLCCRSGKGGREAAFREIESYMTKLDIGIARMELTSESPEDTGARYSEDFMCAEAGSISRRSSEMIYTYHRRADGELVPLRLRDESKGTRMLFGLLGMLLSALHEGRTIVIDELDRSIHPLVLKSLVSLFTDRTYNKHNAQLIFTAHNTELLDGDELRLSEVGIVTKTAQGGTQLRRLCDFEGVRNVKNFRLGYLDGYFSGIPFPSI